MDTNKDYKGIARSVRALFQSNLGGMNRKDLRAVFDILEASLEGEVPMNPSLKMQGEKHLSEIIGTNIRHAFENYEWDNAYPISEDGITVSGLKYR